MKRHAVVFSPRALANLRTLRDFKLGAATSREEANAILDFIEKLPRVITAKLEYSPSLYARLGSDPLLRELKLDSGISAAFRLRPERGEVVVLAVRHQRQAAY